MSDEKKRRGRPSKSQSQEESRDKLHINIAIEEELNEFLVFACDVNGRISKAEFIRRLVKNAYEKNMEVYQAWKVIREKNRFMLDL